MSKQQGRHAPKHAKPGSHSRASAGTGLNTKLIAVIAACAVVLLILLIVLAGRGDKNDDGGKETVVAKETSEISSEGNVISDEKVQLYDKEETFVISCIGDNTLWSSIYFQESTAGLPKIVGDNYDYPFQNTVSYFENDELTISNAENNFSDTKLQSVEQFYFCAPNDYVKILTQGGVDFVTTANNHMMDFGDKGAQSTYDALEAGGLAYGKEKEAQIIKTKSGLKVGIYTAGTDKKPEAFQSDITAAVEQLKTDGADYVIVMLHWGKELYYSPDSAQIELAHACVDAGADLVYGSHSHCLQPVEQYNDGFILYSVGNWVFGGNTAPTDCDTAIIQITIKRDVYGNLTNESFDAIPCCVSSRIDAAQAHRDNYNDYCPTPYEEGTEAYERVISKLQGTYKADKQGADYSNFYASWG